MITLACAGGPRLPQIRLVTWLGEFFPLGLISYAIAFSTTILAADSAHGAQPLWAQIVGSTGRRDLCHWISDLDRYPETCSRDLSRTVCAVCPLLVASPGDIVFCASNGRRGTEWEESIWLPALSRWARKGVLERASRQHSPPLVPEEH
jgi:hypothetical protein